MKRRAFRLLDLWIPVAVLLILGIVKQGPADQESMVDEIGPEIRQEVVQRQQDETLALFGWREEDLVVVTDAQGEPQLASNR